MRALLLLAVFLPLAACTLRTPGPQAVLPRADESWRTIATDEDRERLRDWRDSFVAGLDAAKKAGRAADVAREGALLDPDAALPDAPPPPGAYRCRTVKLGAREAAQSAFATYDPVPCRVGVGVGDKAMTFEMQGGPQRPVGRIFTNINRRMVLLGTLQVGDEQGTLRYGDDTQRDVAGFVERIGERRWRILLPEPHFQSRFDVVELTPA